MKSLICALLLVFVTLSPSAMAQELRAEFALAQFNAPEDGPFLETYLKLKGNSLTVLETDSGHYAEVMIRTRLTRLGAVIFEDAYKVKGPILEDASSPLDFIDQQRMPAKIGMNNLEITLMDVHAEFPKEVTISQDVQIENRLSKVFLSDVQLIDRFDKTTERNILSKAGFDLVPKTDNFFNEHAQQIAFYFEVYNSDRKFGPEQQFLVNMFIENADDGKVTAGLRKYQKRAGAEVVPVLHTFPLKQLGSGNYNLVIEARDQQNELMDRKVLFFQRSNPLPEPSYTMEEDNQDEDLLEATFVARYNRPEELEQFLRCLHPISSQEEITYVNTRINFNDPEMMKRFMYSFWKKRNPENPESAWLKYWEEVKKVEEAYATNLLKGYDTDRGRVYLQYGPPNTISPNYFEPNTFPYEIWHYYTLSDHLNPPQSNRKFVFANTSRGSSEFQLIHSDADNEINNRRWHHDIHQRSTMSTDLDVQDAGSNYGSRSREFFENPY